MEECYIAPSMPWKMKSQHGSYQSDRREKASYALNVATDVSYSVVVQTILLGQVCLGVPFLGENIF